MVKIIKIDIPSKNKFEMRYLKNYLIVTEDMSISLTHKKLNHCCQLSSTNFSTKKSRNKVCVKVKDNFLVAEALSCDPEERREKIVHRVRSGM